MSDTHAHHWQGFQPGPTSTMTCRLCGAQKQFANSSEMDLLWSDYSNQQEARRTDYVYPVVRPVRERTTHSRSRGAA